MGAASAPAVPAVTSAVELPRERAAPRRSRCEDPTGDPSALPSESVCSQGSSSPLSCLRLNRWAGPCFQRCKDFTALQSGVKGGLNATYIRYYPQDGQEPWLSYASRHFAPYFFLGRERPIFLQTWGISSHPNCPVLQAAGERRRW